MTHEMCLELSNLRPKCDRADNCQVLVASNLNASSRPSSNSHQGMHTSGVACDEPRPRRVNGLVDTHAANVHINLPAGTVLTKFAEGSLYGGEKKRKEALNYQQQEDVGGKSSKRGPQNRQSIRLFKSSSCSSATNLDRGKKRRIHHLDAGRARLSREVTTREHE
jgi:hypothetical protein